jgi:hypothetical protein
MPTRLKLVYAYSFGYLTTAGEIRSSDLEMVYSMFFQPVLFIHIVDNR